MTLTELYFRQTTYRGYTLFQLAVDWFCLSNDGFYNKYRFNFNPHEYPGLYEIARKHVYGY